jgi:hypothetical protein
MRIHLSDDLQNVIDTAKEKQQSALEKATAEEQALIAKIEKLTAQGIDREPRITESAEKLNRTREDRERKRRTLDRYQALVDKLDREHRILDRARSRDQTEIQNSKHKLEELKRVKLKLSQDTFSAEAKELFAVRELIDPNYPFEYSRGFMSWTTVPIYIYDYGGVRLNRCFGNFNVKLRVVNNRLSANIYPRDTAAVVHGYPHPHIEPDGRACLGNGANMLMTAVMDGKLGLAVTIVHEYLTSYNRNDPYQSLSEWVPNIWDSGLCSCSLMAKDLCRCPRCPSCGQSAHEVETNPICHSCQELLYKKHPHLSGGLSVGIGGSDLVLRHNINTRCRIELPYVLCYGPQCHH